MLLHYFLLEHQLLLDSRREFSARRNAEERRVEFGRLLSGCLCCLVLARKQAGESACAEEEGKGSVKNSKPAGKLLRNTTVVLNAFLIGANGGRGDIRPGRAIYLTAEI